MSLIKIQHKESKKTWFGKMILKLIKFKINIKIKIIEDFQEGYQIKLMKKFQVIFFKYQKYWKSRV